MPKFVKNHYNLVSDEALSTVHTIVLSDGSSLYDFKEENDGEGERNEERDRKGKKCDEGKVNGITESNLRRISSKIEDVFQSRFNKFTGF